MEAVWIVIAIIVVCMAGLFYMLDKQKKDSLQLTDK